MHWHEHHAIRLEFQSSGVPSTFMQVCTHSFRQPKGTTSSAGRMHHAINCRGRPWQCSYARIVVALLQPASTVELIAMQSILTLKKCNVVCQALQWSLDCASCRRGQSMHAISKGQLQVVCPDTMMAGGLLRLGVPPSNWLLPGDYL